MCVCVWGGGGGGGGGGAEEEIVRWNCQEKLCESVM